MSVVDQRAERGALDFEVEHQRQVVREPDVGDFEADGGDGGVVADEVQLAAGGPAREGGLVVGVGAFQACGAQEHVQLPDTGEGVEVAGHEARLAAVGDQVVQLEELAVTRADAEGEVHEKEGDALELDLDGQAFKAGLEVVEGGAEDRLAGEHGVGLLVEDGHAPAEAVVRVLDAVAVVEVELVGQLLGLVLAPGAVGAGVHLDEADDVGVHVTDEARDVRKVRGGAQQGLQPREAPQPPGAVLDVMEQKPHDGDHFSLNLAAGRTAKRKSSGCQAPAHFF